MTESNPTPDPQPDPQPEQDQEPDETPEESPAVNTGWAVYDTNHLRFIPGVHATRKAAAASAKDAGKKTGRTFEVRKV